MFAKEIEDRVEKINYFKGRESFIAGLGCDKFTSVNGQTREQGKDASLEIFSPTQGG